MKATRGLAWLALAAAAGCVTTAAIRQRRQIDLRNRTVLITGGSRGLGLLLARRFSAAGSRVAICARDVNELQAAVDELRQSGRQVLSVECDLADREQVGRAVRAVRDQWGPVDILINNAGVIMVGPQQEMELQDYRRAMDVHYWGALYATLAVLPEMRRRKQGRIVNITSVGGLISVPHMLPYSGSKFALVGLSEGLRAELLNEGIYVTTVCPGPMRTGSYLHAWFKGRHRAEYTWFSAAASLPLASISADRAADAIVTACRQGRAHLTLSMPAKAARVLHGLAPAMTSDSLALVNRLLPRPGGIGTRRAPGAASRLRGWPEMLTYLGDLAARRNNEQWNGGQRTQW